MLIDRFNRQHNYLRISLTDACNLACRYCMPDKSTACQGTKIGLMKAEEIAILARHFTDLGITRIRLTGGEPLVRKDFSSVVRLLREATGPAVEFALTTNGVLVHRYLDDLVAAGITSVNVSLDSLMPERFEAITGYNSFHRVMSNIHLLLHANIKVKINVVVMKNINDDELPGLVSLSRDYPLDVRFIEFMPFGGNQWGREKLVTMQEMHGRIHDHFDMEQIPGHKTSTSITYKVPGFEGTFSFIPTMSAPFCGNCSRLRITADGKLRNCLFASEESDLLHALRNKGDVQGMILQNVTGKKEKWGGRSLFEASTERSMVSIGG